MTAAIAAIGLASFGYFAVRWAEERERIDNILVAILSTDLPSREDESS